MGTKTAERSCKIERTTYEIKKELNNVLCKPHLHLKILPVEKAPSICESISTSATSEPSSILST